MFLLALQRAPERPLFIIEDAELLLPRGGCAGLMTMFDGVATPVGALLVLTSNNPAVLGRGALRCFGAPWTHRLAPALSLGGRRYDPGDPPDIALETNRAR